MAAVPLTEEFWFKKLSLNTSIGFIPPIVLLEDLVALLVALLEALTFLDLFTAIRSLASIRASGLALVALVLFDLFSGFGSGFFDSSLGFSGSGCFLGSGFGSSFLVSSFFS